MLLTDFFERGLLGDPDRSCMVTADGAHRISWGEADAISARIAAALRDAGMSEGTAVGVLSPNDPSAMLCVLGTLRAGAVWVPLNARSRPGELAALLEKVDCRALIYHERLREAAETILDSVPAIELAVAIGRGREGDPELADWMAPQGASVPRPAYAPDRTAILFGTGGTTGAAKAVRMTHSMLATMILAMEGHMGEPEPSVFAVAAPMTHAAGLTAFLTLAEGGTLVIHDGFHAEALLASIAEFGVTRLFLPPTAIYALLGHPRVREFDYSSLRHFVYAAAPMSADKLAEAIDVFGPVMCQTYGQAEAPMILTCMTPAEHREAVADVRLRGRLASAGRPSYAASVAIMGADGELKPAGETGEIVVRSALVMPGYHRDEEQSHAVRRPGGWHGTNDAGYIDQDGFVYIVDRLRDMIITGGFNVWPSEVERVLHALPAVRDCAVIGLPDPRWGEAVTAVLELHAGAELTEDEAIAACKEQLGSVKAPKQVIFRSLPRSPVGKVLKRELRDEYWRGRERAV